MQIIKFILCFRLTTGVWCIISLTINFNSNVLYIHTCVFNFLNVFFREKDNTRNEVEKEGEEGENDKVKLSDSSQTPRKNRLRYVLRLERLKVQKAEEEKVAAVAKINKEKNELTKKLAALHSGLTGRKRKASLDEEGTPKMPVSSSSKVRKRLNVVEESTMETLDISYSEGPDNTDLCGVNQLTILIITLSIGGTSVIVVISYNYQSKH